MSPEEELYDLACQDMPVTGDEVREALDKFKRAYAHELAEKQRNRLAAGLHMPGYARVLCNNGQFEPMGSTHLIDGIDPEMKGVNRPAREALNELRERKPWEVPGG